MRQGPATRPDPGTERLGEIDERAPAQPAADDRSAGRDDATHPSGWANRWARVARGHSWFILALAAATVVRLVAVLAYRPALWFNDSFEYVAVALRPQPYVVRPDGYSFLLRALLPLHSFTLVTVLQHLMGRATAGLVYALLRRLSLPGWGATLACVPVLFDGYQLRLEHMVLSDTLFTLLCVATVVTVLWRPHLSAVRLASVGLLLAAAVLTRPVALPLVPVLLVFLLVRRVGWRPFAVFLVALVVPLFSYASWFRAVNGNYALTTTSGVFLYSRTATFVDCGEGYLTPKLAPLCPSGKPFHRPPPEHFVWHGGTPLADRPGPLFTRENNALGSQFARSVILHQPLDYARAVAQDLARGFAVRPPSTYPNRDIVKAYSFDAAPVAVPDRVFVSGGSAAQDTRAYEQGDPRTRSRQPFAGWLASYQRYVYLWGPLLFALIVVGLVGCVRGPRSERRTAIRMLTATGLILLVVPTMTQSFDIRYVLPAQPFLAAAAARTLLRLRLPRGVPRPWSRTGGPTPAASSANPDR